MRDIAFGWRIPAFPVDGSSGSLFVQHLRSALDVVQEDYDSVWISDHPIPWASWQQPETPNLEGWTTLNYFAARYETLVFGNIVLCNSYRNPALVAKMAATLDFLTEGRFVLGIGAGWKEDEYQMYGYPFPKPSIRIAQLAEAVQLIKRMWRENRVTFHGQFYQVENVACQPKPRNPPPIMIGGCGEKLLLRVVARYADWWNCPNLTETQYRQKLEVLRRHCRAVGRSYDSIRKVWLGGIAIAETESDAFTIAQQSPFVTQDTRFDALKTTIIGTPDQVRTRLQNFQKLGVDYFIIRFLDFPRTKGTTLFAQHVIPNIDS